VGRRAMLNAELLFFRILSSIGFATTSVATKECPEHSSAEQLLIPDDVANGYIKRSLKYYFL
jgi:hypothetical protein